MVDDLLVRARLETALTHRVDLYRRAEQLVLDDPALLPVWHDTDERVFQSYVRDVEVNDLGVADIPMRTVRLDRRR